MHPDFKNDGRSTPKAGEVPLIDIKVMNPFVETL